MVTDQHYHNPATTRAIGLEGPEVDATCNAREPDADQWEAGMLYPRWDQIVALSALTQFPVSFFMQPLLAPVMRTSLRFHGPNSYGPTLCEPRPVQAFHPDVAKM